MKFIEVAATLVENSESPGVLHGFLWLARPKRLKGELEVLKHPPSSGDDSQRGKQVAPASVSGNTFYSLNGYIFLYNSCTRFLEAQRIVLQSHPHSFIGSSYE